LKVLILLLVGGIIGYLMGSAGPGRWCGWHHHGGSDAMPMAMDQTSAK
jgi:hypothetical protein